MTKQALKSQLHQFIDTIEDEETLIVLNESFNTIAREEDILDELSNEQKERLQQALQQANNGDLLSNESVKNQIKEWLSK